MDNVLNAKANGIGRNAETQITGSDILGRKTRVKEACLPP